MKSSALKKLFKERYNLTVRASTTPTKQRWVSVWLPYPGETKTNNIFPAELRQALLAFIYPRSTGPAAFPNATGGNITERGLALTETQWEQFFNEFSNAKEAK